MFSGRVECFGGALPLLVFSEKVYRFFSAKQKLKEFQLLHVAHVFPRCKQLKCFRLIGEYFSYV